MNTDFQTYILEAFDGESTVEFETYRHRDDAENKFNEFAEYAARIGCYARLVDADGRIYRDNS